MKICPKCRAQLADDSFFCTGCGQKIEEGTGAQAATVCQKCGSPLSSDTRFCTKCGTPVGKAMQSTPQFTPTQIHTPPSAPLPTTGKTSAGTSSMTKNLPQNPTMLIGGILLLVLVIGGFLYFNFSSSSGIPQTETSTASNTQQTMPQQNRQSSSSSVSQSQRQSEPSNSQPPRRDVVSELMLADVGLGDSYSTVRQVLGTPYKEEQKEHGKIYYYFPSVEVHCKNGIVTTLISNSPEAKTPKGIHEGSTYRAMLKAYGGNWTRSTYGDLDLYEYNFTAQDGRTAILRFAISTSTDPKRRERVDYISIRYQ